MARTLLPWARRNSVGGDKRESGGWTPLSLRDLPERSSSRPARQSSSATASRDCRGARRRSLTHDLVEDRRDGGRDDFHQEIRVWIQRRKRGFGGPVCRLQAGRSHRVIRRIGSQIRDAQVHVTSGERKRENLRLTWHLIWGVDQNGIESVCWILRFMWWKTKRHCRRCLLCCVGEVGEDTEDIQVGRCKILTGKFGRIRFDGCLPILVFRPSQSNLLVRSAWQNQFDQVIGSAWRTGIAHVELNDHFKSKI